MSLRWKLGADDACRLRDGRDIDLSETLARMRVHFREARGIGGLDKRVVVDDCVFFFQAEDGIRDYKVTGVQTCALPILLPLPPARASISASFSTFRKSAHAVQEIFRAGFLPAALEIADSFTLKSAREFQIGRASCRERV